MKIKMEQGIMTHEVGQIKYIGVRFLQNMLSLEANPNEIFIEYILAHIPRLIIKENNKKLVKPLSFPNIEAMSFSMTHNKYSGPNGFTVEVC